MTTEAIIQRESTSERYDAVLRISEALCACCEPQQLAESLANEIENFLQFDHLYLAVLKENSKEVEYRVCGKGRVPLPDLPIEELPNWEAISSPDPLAVVHWDADERSPRFKQWAREMGFGEGCVKKTRDRHAVRKMKEGPSEPPCRRRLQTATSCYGPKGRGGERCG